MAFLDILIGVFTLANTFIAFFIVVFAFLFLRKTKSHKDRRPWDYLFLASMIYLMYNLFLILLQIFGISSLFYSLNLYELSVFFQFIYTGLILLAFISQTDLIFNNDIIIIMKKENSNNHQPEAASSQQEHTKTAEEPSQEKEQPAESSAGLEDVVKSQKTKTVPRFEPKKTISKKGSSRKVSSKKKR